LQHWNALPEQVVKFPSLEVTEKQVGQELVRNDIEISDLLFEMAGEGLLQALSCT